MFYMCSNFKFFLIVSSMKPVNFYILHSKQLTEREASVTSLTTLLSPMGNVQVITEYDPNEITPEFIQSHINYQQFQEPALVKYNAHIKNIHIQQFSNTLKHYRALELIKSGSPDEFHIVLEDDMLYGDNIVESLKETLTKITDEKIVCLGLPIAEAQEANIKPVEFEQVPFFDSYLVSPAFAQTLYDAYFPVRFTTVPHFNSLLTKLDVKASQATKNLFVNGSKYGLFVSTLNSNNILVLNKEYMAVAERLNKHVITPDDEAFIKKINETTSIAKSPDFMYLMGNFLLRTKKYKEAEEVFKQSYSVIVGNHGIINHESLLLKDFIALYKYLQVY